MDFMANNQATRAEVSRSMITKMNLGIDLEQMNIVSMNPYLKMELL